MSTVPFRDDEGRSTRAASPRCERCEAPLTLHQPDPDLPDRLLSTCDDCKSWYVFEDDLGMLIGPTEVDGVHRRPRRPAVVA